MGLTMFKRELVDVGTGRHYVARPALAKVDGQPGRQHCVGARPQMARCAATRPMHAAAATSGTLTGLLLVVVGAIGLYCVVAASPYVFLYVCIALFCIIVAFIGACKMSSHTPRI